MKKLFSKSKKGKKVKSVLKILVGVKTMRKLPIIKKRAAKKGKAAVKKKGKRKSLVKVLVAIGHLVRNKWHAARACRYACVRAILLKFDPDVLKVRVRSRVLL